MDASRTPSASRKEVIPAGQGRGSVAPHARPGRSRVPLFAAACSGTSPPEPTTPSPSASVPAPNDPPPAVEEVPRADFVARLAKADLRGERAVLRRVGRGRDMQVHDGHVLQAWARSCQWTGVHRGQVWPGQEARGELRRARRVRRRQHVRGEHAPLLQLGGDVPLRGPRALTAAVIRVGQRAVVVFRSGACSRTKTTFRALRVSSSISHHEMGSLAAARDQSGPRSRAPCSVARVVLCGAAVLSYRPGAASARATSSSRRPALLDGKRTAW